MDFIIETRQLTRRYGPGIAALDGVDLTVPAGEFLAVVGRSGSGKSTLLNIVGCLDAPTSGEVFIGGRRVDYADRRTLVGLRRGTIGFVFQQFNLIPHLTAGENVAYPLLFNYRPRGERTARAEALLAAVGLADRAGHYPAELSGGEQQRVAIARALVADPLVVLADEPTGNLDSRTSEGIVALMRNLNEERATTFVVVTHERELGAYADRTVEMVDGRVAD
jgi:putative ABC transport system ATP-binding protein